MTAHSKVVPSSRWTAARSIAHAGGAVEHRSRTHRGIRPESLPRGLLDGLIVLSLTATALAALALALVEGSALGGQAG